MKSDEAAPLIGSENGVPPKLSTMFFKFAAMGAAGGDMLFGTIGAVSPETMEAVMAALPSWANIAMPVGLSLEMAGAWIAVAGTDAVAGAFQAAGYPDLANQIRRYTQPGLLTPLRVIIGHSLGRMIGYFYSRENAAKNTEALAKVTHNV